MSNSVWPHRQQPTRLPSPWDSPGKNTGCHFLLQCMKVKSESEVALSCPTLSDPMDYSLPGSSINGVFQARVLEWGATAFSGLMSQSSLNGEQHLGRLCLTLWSLKLPILRLSLQEQEIQPWNHVHMLLHLVITFCKDIVALKISKPAPRVGMTQQYTN